MKKFIFCIFLCSITNFVYAEGEENDSPPSSGNGTWIITAPDDPSTFIEPTRMTEDDNEATFKLVDLIGTSMNGMLDKDCGGYCLVGFCLHFAWGFSIWEGPYIYTIVSPKIRHALPELLISAHDGVGRESMQEWRDSFGKVMKKLNEEKITSILGTPNGQQGGESYKRQYNASTFKEIDIIGHPMTMLPGLVNGSEDEDDFESQEYDTPNFGSLNNLNLNSGSSSGSSGSNNSSSNNSNSNGGGIYNSIQDKVLKETGLDNVSADSFNFNNLLNSTGKLNDNFQKAMQTIKLINQIDSLKVTAETIEEMKEMMNQTLDETEEELESDVWWINLIRPDFRMPRFYCDTEMTAFQPYYMSFLDSFWWRTGYPITDGPISGSNKSSTILDPFSFDTLPKVSSTTDLLTEETWGHLYPRDGSIAQTHEGKASSVLAWRALDVLKTSVKSGYRVGIDYPESLELKRGISNTDGSSNSDSDSNNTPIDESLSRWQMVFPKVMSCKREPFYQDNSTQEVNGIDTNIPKDSVKISSGGTYAWNYYRTYQCCSNKKGWKVAAVNTIPICIPLDDVLNGIEEDRVAHEQFVRDSNSN